jgi:hypothetical protein
MLKRQDVIITHTDGYCSSEELDDDTVGEYSHPIFYRMTDTMKDSNKPEDLAKY